MKFFTQILFVAVLMVFVQTTSNAQVMTETDLKTKIAEKKAELDKVKGELASLEGSLDKLPGWRKGLFGTLGYNLAGFSNWAKQANPNSFSSTILGSVNAFANLHEDKYFFRNALNIAGGWQKLVVNRNAPEGNEDEFKNTADLLRINSLYGYKIMPKLALSAMGDYNTSLFSNFNNPGTMDIGAGLTWTPVQDLVVVLHPLNGHFIFARDFDVEKSFVMGAKLMADYSRQLPMGISWKTNLTSFVPYQSTDPSTFEYTWTNGLAFNAWKGIGVGIEFALRKSELENRQINVGDDKIQSYYTIGLSYAL